MCCYSKKALLNIDDQRRRQFELDCLLWLLQHCLVDWPNCLTVRLLAGKYPNTAYQLGLLAYNFQDSMTSTCRLQRFHEKTTNLSADQPTAEVLTVAITMKGHPTKDYQQQPDFYSQPTACLKPKNSCG